MVVVSICYVVMLGGSVDATYFYAALLMYFELLLVTALSVLLSCLASPILAALIVFCLYAEAANGIAVEPSYVAWAVVYGLIYTGMLLALAAIAFEDKDV
jgi:hypothetical protein